MLHDRCAGSADGKRVADWTIHSIKCSLAIISDSACTTMLQLLPVASKSVDIVAKPRPSTLPYRHARRRSFLVEIPHPHLRRETVFGSSRLVDFQSPRAWTGLQDRDLVLPPVHRTGLHFER